MSFSRYNPEDSVISSEAVVRGLWSGDNNTLNYFYTSSTFTEYYLDVYNACELCSGSVVQFAIQYGNINGSGSKLINSAVSGASPSRIVYGEYRNLVYGTEDAYFSFDNNATTGSDIFIINDKPIFFDVSTSGKPDLQYVYGVDPASEKDNFSIVILELHPDHNRVVYCWTTNRNNFKERQKTGLVLEHDFYGFCARKIRNLMKTFPCAKLGMDAQGGGVAIEEVLHDPSKLDVGENLIWPIIENKEKDTDHESGLHILELVQFARADWTAQANHGLRKDLEDKLLIFPRFDQLSLALALDKENKDIMETSFDNLYDSESELILEIEELKNELTTIVMTQTSSAGGARDRWDTPEVKLPNGKKGKLRKDRYSALVIANMLARQINRASEPLNYDVIGSNLRDKGMKQSGNMYKGPNWFTEGANDNIYKGVYR